MSIVFDKQQEIFEKLQECRLLDEYNELQKQFKEDYNKLRKQILDVGTLVEVHALQKELKESADFLTAEFMRHRSKVFSPARWIKIETEGDGPELMVLDSEGAFIVSDGKNLLNCSYLSLVKYDDKYYLKEADWGKE